MSAKQNGFTFKQFHIEHHRCAMKVGTDGILLGAWADVSQAERILDLGTGTGLIALMLAQRSTKESEIHAVELDKAAYKHRQIFTLRHGHSVCMSINKMPPNFAKTL